MKKIPLSEVKDDLSHYIHLAEGEEIVVTRHGRPAAVIIGFKDEDDWFDYRLENDPRFLAEIARAREEVRSGMGVPIEKLLEERREQPAVRVRRKSTKRRAKKRFA